MERSVDKWLTPASQTRTLSIAVLCVARVLGAKPRAWRKAKYWTRIPTLVYRYTKLGSSTGKYFMANPAYSSTRLIVSASDRHPFEDCIETEQHLET